MSSPKLSTTRISKGNHDFDPAIARFSPTPSSQNNRQKTVLVGQKSPLLIATPPQITRALAFSHPFLLPLNKCVGLITWSSGDPWESFLLIVAFWTLVLYGDQTIRWAGPVLLVGILIAGMYTRRYSPLSTTGSTGEQVKGHKRDGSTGVKHQKSLDEIVDTLNVFTSRCNILMDPLFQLTDFLSTQRTATSATTRPALTSLFIRILMVLPIWLILTLPPLSLLTSRHIVLMLGTICLSWHSRPARVSRVILWRSITVRYVVSVVTGLKFSDSTSQLDEPPALPPRESIQQHDVANSLASTGGMAGVRFTFVVYENQRRWLGLGWTSSLFAYERAAWTDEHLNATLSKNDFKLPMVDGANAKWQWVPGSDWSIEGDSKSGAGKIGKGSKEGWIFYDNKAWTPWAFVIVLTKTSGMTVVD